MFQRVYQQILASNHSRTRNGLTPVHKTTTLAAEVVGHGITGLDGLARGVSLDFVLPTHVSERVVLDGEVGAERGRAEVPTVSAIANKLFVLMSARAMKWEVVDLRW